jgi:hypothetical protein
MQAVATPWISVESAPSPPLTLETQPLVLTCTWCHYISASKNTTAHGQSNAGGREGVVQLVFSFQVSPSGHGNNVHFRKDVRLFTTLCKRGKGGLSWWGCLWAGRGVGPDLIYLFRSMSCVETLCNPFGSAANLASADYTSVPQIVWTTVHFFYTHYAASSTPVLNAQSAHGHLE